METFSALLVICAGNSPVPGELPAQRPVTRSLDVLFDLRLNKRLSKQSWGWWFETLSRRLWRHRNVDDIHTGVETYIAFVAAFASKKCFFSLLAGRCMGSKHKKMCFCNAPMGRHNIFSEIWILIKVKFAFFVVITSVLTSLRPTASYIH